MNLLKPDEVFGYLTTRASKTLASEIEKRFQITDVEIQIETWAILVHLWQKDGRSQFELTECLFKDKSSIARALKSMEAQNLIVRICSQQDKRIKEIHLTHKGKELKHTLIPIVRKVHEDACKGISEEDLATAKQVLRTIYHNING